MAGSMAGGLCSSQRRHPGSNRVERGCRIRSRPNDYLQFMAVPTRSRRRIMKYLCLIYSEEVRWDKASQAETEQMMSDYRAFGESIQDSGHHLSGFRLRPTTTATTLRMRDGK